MIAAGSAEGAIVRRMMERSIVTMVIGLKSMVAMSTSHAELPKANSRSP